MSTFDELFGELGPAYTPLIYAHLQIQAEKGNEEAARLIGYADLPTDAPQPGDVVLAKERTWVYDSADGDDYVWWSPQSRESVAADGLEDYEVIVWHGRHEMPPAAIELWDATTWALSTLHLCEQKQNPRTKAKYFAEVAGCDSISDLIDLYRSAVEAAPA